MIYQEESSGIWMGDTAYELFCEAVTIFEERLVERGAELVQEGLKIELAQR